MQGGGELPFSHVRVHLDYMFHVDGAIRGFARSKQRKAAQGQEAGDSKREMTFWFHEVVCYFVLTPDVMIRSSLLYNTQSLNIASLI